jgi:hypothetical protein
MFARAGPDLIWPHLLTLGRLLSIGRGVIDGPSTSVGCKSVIRTFVPLLLPTADVTHRGPPAQPLGLRCRVNGL